MSYADIFYAAQSGTVEDVKYFIEKKGVNVNTKRSDTTSLFLGETPLHTAAYYGNVEVVKYLISKGANINEKNNVGFTPLHNAAMDTGHEEHDTGKLEVAELLISKGADVNIEGPDDLKPLDFAMAGRMRIELRQYLESVGGRSESDNGTGGGRSESDNGTGAGKILMWIGIGIGVIILIAMCSSC